MRYWRGPTLVRLQQKMHILNEKVFGGGEADLQLFFLLLQWRTQPQEEKQYVAMRRLAVNCFITAVVCCPDSIDSCAAQSVLDDFSWQPVWNTN